MEFHGRDVRSRIPISDGQSLSSGSRTTVEDVRAVPDESSNELRSFILNNAEARAESRGPGHISVLHSACGGQERPGSEFDSFGFDLLFSFRTAEADCGHRDRLIVSADAKGGIESVGLNPAFDEPQRVGTTGSEGFCRSIADCGLRGVVDVGDVRVELPQDRIDEGCSRTLAGALDELYAFIDGGTGGNAAEPTQLVNREAERGENLEVKFGEWLGRARGNL